MSQTMCAQTCLIVVLLMLIALCLSPVAAVRGMRLDNSRSCEPIRVEACHGLGYNVTAMPNFAAHETQNDADLQIQTFAPLIQYGCSSQLRFFLCSVYVPMCTEKVAENIGPCRPLCQSVKERCHPVLVEFGFPWPSSLDCNNFPAENNHEHMCMDGPGEEIDSPPGPVKSSTTSTRPPVHYHNPGMAKKPSDSASRKKTGPLDQMSDLSDLIPGIRPSLPSTGTSSSSAAICSKYRHASEYYYVNRTETCSHKCSADILFSGENKEFAETWLRIWSIVCLLTTGFAIYSFLADSAQFRYPERIIVIMSFTYFMYTLGNFVRLIFGREEISCHQESQHNVSLLITEGPDNFSCTIVFVVIYFFGMSSALWWVNLTITWFLSAGLGWSPETIEQKSSYFHFVAWLIPSIKTLAILIMRAVDADELTGSCFIGNHSKGTLLAFVIIPSSFYLLLGSFFLCARLYCYYLSKQMKTCTSLRVRHGSHHSSASSSHHSASHTHISAHTLSHSPLSSCCNPKDQQELMNWKISCFTIFYMLPALFHIAFNVYEYLERDSWYLNGSPDRPSLELYTIKIFMNFVVGIQSGLWIWSLRTPARICGQMCQRFRQSKPSPHPKATYLVPQVNPVATMMSTAPSSVGGMSTLPPHFARYSYQQSQQQQAFSTIDKNNRPSRGLGKGGETTV